MPRKGLTTAKVVEEAAELADAEGLHTVTLGRLGKRLGVQVPSLYKHVDGVADLFRRLTETANRQLAEMVRQACTGRSGRDALSVCCHSYRAFARRFPGRYAAIQHPAEPAADGELEDARADLLRVAADALRAYRLLDHETIPALRIVRSALHGFVSLENHSAFRLEVDADVTFNYLIELLDAGLTRRAG